MSDPIGDVHDFAHNFQQDQFEAAGAGLLGAFFFDLLRFVLRR
jgi:hypothetical protein